MSDDHLVAFTPNRAAQLTGLSRRQVDYWRKTLLLEPAIDERVTAHRSVRLYDFTDMVALMTVAELLARGVSLQGVRRIVDAMRRYGHDRPLTQISFGTVTPQRGKKDVHIVTMTLADGTVVGDDDPGQVVMSETIDIEAIQTRIRRGAVRATSDIGRIERRRNTKGSREVFAGTRVPVATVRAYLAEGVPDDEIFEAFPALEPADLVVARVAV